MHISMNNTNNNNLLRRIDVRAHELIDIFEEAPSARDLAAAFANMTDHVGVRASPQFKDLAAGVMALGRYLDGDGGHVWASAEYEHRMGGLNVPKMKVLFDNMTQKTMGAVLVAIAKHHDKGKKAVDLIKELVLVRAVSPNATLSTAYYKNSNNVYRLDTEFARRTALHFAHGPSIVKVLLQELGANPNARDAAGQTPLHMEWGASASKTKALLAAGANPNARDADGRTPMFYHVGHPDCIKALLAAGADPYAKDKKGITALNAILKLLMRIGGAKTPPDAAKTVKILMAATDARPTNARNVNIAKLPANLQNAISKRANLGRRRYNETSAALLLKGMNPNMHSKIMQNAF